LAQQHAALLSHHHGNAQLNTPKSQTSALILPSCLITLVIVGCQPVETESVAPPVKTANASPPVAVPDDAGTAASERQVFDGMSFVVPPKWASQPLSQMQKGIIAARFGVPEVNNDITVTLSVSGGSKQDNISRWEGQFGGGTPPQQESIRTGGGDADLIRLAGRFSPGFGRPTQDDWTMLGLIIPMGERHYFVKLTGPSADINRVEQEFLDFCKSARPA
jgi:hypothetical protein